MSKNIAREIHVLLDVGNRAIFLYFQPFLHNSYINHHIFLQY